jgi:hypothetical protein
MKTDSKDKNDTKPVPPEAPGSRGEGLGAPEDKGGKGNPNQIVLTVVVNGQPTDVKANVNAPLRIVRDKA